MDNELNGRKKKTIFFTIPFFLHRSFRVAFTMGLFKEAVCQVCNAANISKSTLKVEHGSSVAGTIYYLCDFYNVSSKPPKLPTLNNLEVEVGGGLWALDLWFSKLYRKF